MGPQAIMILEAAIQWGPVVGRAVKDLLSMSEPTNEDWEKLFTKMKEQRKKSYFDLVPASKLQDG